MSAVSLRDVVYRYGRVAALDGVSLSVEPARICALLGPNGAGKSTLIGSIAGLLEPRSGTVELLGKAMPREAEAALRGVGVAFESAAFFGALSGRANLRAFARLKGLADAEADALLERLGLAGPVAARAVSTYSLGTRQRLSLARAFLGRPRLVVLDEPFNALDPDGVIEVRRLIRERRERDGAAFLISSHNLAEMERLADRIVILRAGRVVCEDDTEALVRRAGARYRFEVDDAKRAAAALAPAGPAESDRGIEVAVERHEVPALIARLVGARIAVFEVREVVPTLEDVFRNLVSSGAPFLREDEGGRRER